MKTYLKIIVFMLVGAGLLSACTDDNYKTEYSNDNSPVEYKTVVTEYNVPKDKKQKPKYPPRQPAPIVIHEHHRPSRPAIAVIVRPPAPVKNHHRGWDNNHRPSRDHGGYYNPPHISPPRPVRPSRPVYPPPHVSPTQPSGYYSNGSTGPSIKLVKSPVNDGGYYSSPSTGNGYAPAPALKPAPRPAPAPVPTAPEPAPAPTAPSAPTADNGYYSR